MAVSDAFEHLQGTEEAAFRAVEILLFSWF